MERENNKPKVVRKTNVNVVELNKLRIEFNKHIEDHPSGGGSGETGGGNTTVKFKTLGLGEAVEIIT